MGRGSESSTEMICPASLASAAALFAVRAALAGTWLPARTGITAGATEASGTWAGEGEGEGEAGEVTTFTTGTSFGFFCGFARGLPAASARVPIDS